MRIAAPERHGLDGARLGAIGTLIQQRYLDTALLPNAQLLVARDGEIVHFDSRGAARADSDQPIDVRSIFRIASMTKPITSVGFMMLVEQGKVALDTPVADVLPEFRDVGVFNGGGGGVPFATLPPGAPMRMIDLLRHTSGLSYGFQYRTNVDAAYRVTGADADRVAGWHEGDDLDGWVAKLARLPLEFPAGAAWNYSVSTDLLGAIIQRLSGQPLDDYLATRIFAPLGMVDTGFTVPADKAGRLTDCHVLDATGRRVMFDAAANSLWLKRPHLLSGGGGLASTALDYHRFCRMCENGGELDGARILGRKTLELMTLNHLPGRSDLSSLSRSMFSETQNGGAGFGLGFAVTQDPVRAMLPGSIGEYYWGGMFSTSFFIDPVERLHVIFMTQLGPSSAYPIRREIKTMVYAALT